MPMTYNITTAKAEALRTELALSGLTNARVRKMRNGAGRLVIASVDDRDAARDALVMVNACTISGNPFTKPESRFAWNGPTELFFRFLNN